MSVAAPSEEAWPEVVDLRSSDEVDSIEEPDEIRGMMPSQNLLRLAHRVIASERASVRRLQRLEEARAQRHRAGHRRTRRTVAAALVVVVVAAIAAWELRPATRSAPITVATPVAALPWRTVASPAGDFDVQLPAKPSIRSATSIAGAGVALDARIPGLSMTVASYAAEGGEAAVRPAALALLEERADANAGHLTTVVEAAVRIGTAFDAEVESGAPVALLRVVFVGSTVYLIEVDGDPTLARTRAVYDQVALSFQPTNTH